MKFFKNIKFFILLRNINHVTKKLLVNIELNYENNLYLGIIFFHLSKLFSLSTVAFYLIKKNYLRESDLILRSFWETYVNLVFICQKPEIRSNQFNLDELQKYLGRRYIILKYINKETKETIKVQINKTQKEIEKVKEYLKKIDSNTDYEKFKWKSISAEEKAKELDLTKEYELLYRNWSESAHPSSTTGQDYLNIKGSIVKAIMPSEFNGRMIPERILLLSQGLIKTLSLIYKEFELKPEYKFLNKKILDKLTSHYNTLNPEI